MVDQHNSFEFFEDDEEDSAGSRLDLIEVQRKIFADIFSLGVSPSDSTDDEDNQVEIGGDGSTLDKRILTFKVLVFDQQA